MTKVQRRTRFSDFDLCDLEIKEIYMTGIEIAGQDILLHDIPLTYCTLKVFRL